MHQTGASSGNFPRVLPRKRFQADASDLFLSNTISAKRFARLLANAKVSGASVDRTFKENSRNVARDLRRKMRKNKPWPRVYLASAPCRSCKTGQMETMKVPMWLPHELIHMLSETTDPARLLLRERCSPQILEHLTMVEKNMSFQAGSVIPLSLWMDGVPFNNNRSKSIELCSLALIGQGSDVRLPIFMIPKDFVASDITIKALFEIVRWSFEQLMCCKMPSTRHDGSPFLSSDCRRARLAGSDIPPAALCQVRGDWVCYKQHFDLAGCLAAFCFVLIRYDFFYLDFLLLCFQKRMAREERVLFPLQDHTRQTVGMRQPGSVQAASRTP